MPLTDDECKLIGQMFHATGDIPEGVVIYVNGVPCVGVEEADMEFKDFENDEQNEMGQLAKLQIMVRTEEL